MKSEEPATPNIRLTVNGETRALRVQPHWTLSRVLRREFGLTGAKEACGEGACGACTVLVDGVATPSCMILAVEQEGKSIVTIEGLSKNGVLHPIQEAWLEEYGAQCGFCSPGMIMSALGLLAKNPDPDEEQIKEALGGNLCICSNYEHIIAAVKSAARKMAKEASHG
ncbi:(2Fe-2S)-binding protein [Desulfovibrio sulfodismutans]|uniref:(2Fe-2S)-binding protein n=1 Tax=Desulfolutivibrio sulfodismutans TaxID=63561 RepID=A0A7K3NH58_9BACT|nr:(2Fe-2S)-binding protein [Desulfolutivibrio sulfodismutans]NDY55427.1 (2Fe-2S)-binding protein [Desulfolutivibrio sulfodismutans]QLA12201.1 2Fe-2S iron-sulfur cluster binding domain-containing protein [Desulfolutivibrio sulfodismutans DSM 3696]